MTLSHDDPRLTAFALGELDGAEREEIQTAVEQSSELQSLVEEIRALAGDLSAGLGAEAASMAMNSRDHSSAPAGAGTVGALDSTGSASLHPWLLSSTPSGVEGIGNSVAQESRRLRGVGTMRRIVVPLSLAAGVALACGVVYRSLPSLFRAREHSSTLATRFNKDADLAMPPPSVPAPASSAIARRVATKEELAKRKSLVGMGGSGANRPMGPSINDPSRAEYKASIEAAQGKNVATEFQPLADAGDEVAPIQLQSLGYISGAPPEKARSVVSADQEHLARARAGEVGLQQQAQHLRLQQDERFRGARVQGLAGEGYTSESFIGKCEPSSTDPLRCVRLDWENNGEAYSAVSENPFREVLREPLSTFSIDVDTASYANVRRFLQQGSLPPRDAIRIEEMINYFDYNYSQPVDEHPFSVNVEVAGCPWEPQHRLARIGIKGYELGAGDRPAANLVFLIDVSGSMNQPNKLPLVQESMELLVNQLRRDDSVAMVVYAGASGLALPATSGGNRNAILDAIDRLQAGGSTNGGAGIQLAYDTAIANYREGGINRVILATDGDFNVGVQNRDELQRLIEEKARSGVFLSVLGYGMGNLKDATLEVLADKGNGNYAYIDTIQEAQKVLVEQMSGTLVTIAKDVKIQVEFNPAEVGSYRLIGYENRMLAAQDFNDDRKDAGEIGAGHTVTALYEIVPAGLTPPDDAPAVDPLKYQLSATEPRSHEATEGDATSPSTLQGEGRGEGHDNLTAAALTGELMTVKLRYKEPDEDVSKLIEVPVVDSGAAFEDSSDDFAFAASVASFGMLLRQSFYTKATGSTPADAIDLFDYDFVREVAAGSSGADPYGYRAEFLQLVETAKALSSQ